MEDVLWKTLPVVVLVVQGLFAWFLWSLRRNFVSCDACASVRAEYDKRQAEHDKRLGCVAAEGKELRVILSNLPTVKDVHELGREVERVQGGQEALRESVKSLAVSIDRLERPLNLLLEHQINGGDQK